MSEEDEKLNNFLLYKIWATDEEMEEMMPVLAIGAIVFAVILILINVLCKDVKTSEPKIQPVKEQVLPLEKVTYE